MNIVHAGVILIVYVFVTITAFVFISGSFEDIVTYFEDINSTASDSHIESSGTLVRTSFNMVFAGLILVPVIWFVYWAFSREPDWRYR